MLFRSPDVMAPAWPLDSSVPTAKLGFPFVAPFFSEVHLNFAVIIHRNLVHSAVVSPKTQGEICIESVV